MALASMPGPSCPDRSVLRSKAAQSSSLTPLRLQCAAVSVRSVLHALEQQESFCQPYLPVVLGTSLTMFHHIVAHICQEVGPCIETMSLAEFGRELELTLKTQSITMSN